jgi:hypothetical protein
MDDVREFIDQASGSISKENSVHNSPIYSEELQICTTTGCIDQTHGHVNTNLIIADSN